MSGNFRWLARVAASAVVRRLVFLAIVALVGLLAMCGKAHAQADPYVNCTQSYSSTALCSDRDTATQVARSSAIYQCEHHPAHDAGSTCTITGEVLELGNKRTRFTFKLLTSGGGVLNAEGSVRFWIVECTGGAVWNGTTNKCDVDCSGKPPLGPVSFAGDSGVCNDGCSYVVGLGPDTATYRTIGAVGSPERKTFAAAVYANGDTCTVGEQTTLGAYDPDKSVCVSTGGAYSECVKPSGEHCVTSAVGISLCWTATEVGQRQTADGKLAADRQDAPATPTPPDNQEGSTQDGTTSTTTINGNTYNTAVFNGTGTKGGQGNTGVPGDKDGDGKGKGEGGEDSTSVGGGNCGSPPVSTGDAILSQIAFQTWKTRCADDQPGWTKGDGPTIGEPEVGDPSQQTAFGIPISTDFLDQENIFGASSCPTFEIPNPLGEGVVSTGEMPFWCTLLAIMRGVILLWGGYTAIRILQGAVI